MRGRKARKRQIVFNKELQMIDDKIYIKLFAVP
jgi:hypothetical protein